MKSSKLLLVSLGAAAVLASLTASASAGRLSITERALAAAWLRADFTGGFGTTECELILGYSLHSQTITKTAASLIGYVVTARVGPNGCARGSATVLAETLPWHVRYQGFSGTLPRITWVGLAITGMSFQIREPVFGILCLARSTAAQPVLETLNLEFGRLRSHSFGGAIETSCRTAGALTGTSALVEPAATISLI